MYCKLCGREISGAAKFCPYCGGCISNEDAAFSVGHPVKRKNKKLYFVVLGGVLMVGAILGFFTITRKVYDNNPQIAKTVNVESQTQIESLKEILAPIEKDGKWGYINAIGEVVIEPMYDETWGFFEGLAAVRIGEKWGYINKKNEVVIDIIYDSAGEFSQGVAPVEMGEYWGYINVNGVNITPFKYDEAGGFSDGVGVARVYDVDGLEYHLINQDGDIINIINDTIDGKEFDSYYGYSEGLAPISVTLYRDEMGMGYCWDGYMDKTGNIAIEPVYYRARGFSEGLASVGFDGKLGYINKDGEVVIDFQYDDAGDFSEGIAAVAEGDGGYLIDSKGNIVLDNDKFVFADDYPDPESSYTNIHQSMRNGMISAYDKENPDICYIIDCDGRILFEIDREKYGGYYAAEGDTEGIFIFEWVDPEDDYSAWSEAGAYITKDGEVLWSHID